MLRNGVGASYLKAFSCRDQIVFIYRRVIGPEELIQGLKYKTKGADT